MAAVYTAFHHAAACSSGSLWDCITKGHLAWAWGKKCSLVLTQGVWQSMMASPIAGGIMSQRR